MSSFPAKVPFAIVLCFPRRILKLTSDVQDLIPLWTSESKTVVNISLSTSAGPVRFLVVYYSRILLLEIVLTTNTAPLL